MTCHAPRALLLAFVMPFLACHRAEKTIETYKVEPVQFARRVSAEGNLKSFTATPLSAPNDAPGALKIAWIANDGALVKKDDLIVRFDATDFQQELLGGHEDRDTAGNKIKKASTDTSTTRVNLKRDASQADEELRASKRFRYDDAEVFSRYQRIESELDEKLAGEKKNHAESVLSVRENLSKADRDLLAIEERKADLRIRNAEQGLHSLEMHAPYDGILVLQRDWRGDVPRVGATAWPGMPLGELPDLSKMKAEVFVLEADAAGLAVGQKATITLESNPGVAYSGKISNVDKLARPRVKNVPVQYFGVTVELDRTDKQVMKPGTRVRALLEVESRAGAFSIPRQAVFEKEGKKVVYRRSGDTFVPAEVTIGTSSPGRVVVVKGVKKDDELALRDPTVDKDQKG